MNSFNESIKAPINPCLKFTEKQLDHRNHLYNAIRNNQLNFILSECFCGKTQKDEIIDNYDAWGLNIPTVICGNCYSIRSKYFLDRVSIKKFYKEGYYYPHMFTSYSAKNIGMEFEEYYQEELMKGDNIFKFIKKYIDLSKIQKVVEVGCGAGGILHSFEKEKKKIYGCDWSQDLIDFAKKKMPNAKFSIGDIDSLGEDKFDLLILSDVVEHLTDPNLFFSKIYPYLNFGKYIYINVPGFFGIGLARWNCKIRQYFKIEHTYCHNLYSLSLLMNKSGFNLLHGNEHVRAIYQKKSDFEYSINKNMKLKIKKFIFFSKIKYFVFILTRLNTIVSILRPLLSALKKKIN